MTWISITKTKDYDQFATTEHFTSSDNSDDTGDDTSLKDIVKEKDAEISNLKSSLEQSQKEVSEAITVKESLSKTKLELRAAQRSSNIVKNKLEFACKVREQRMSNCLSSEDPDVEEELVTLYSTLIDEENFSLEDDNVIAQKDFLKQVEDKITERGKMPGEAKKLSEVRKKILEKVKLKLVDRARSRERRDSIGSVRSSSSKRSSTDVIKEENKSRKTAGSSLSPLSQ